MENVTGDFLTLFQLSLVGQTDFLLFHPCSIPVPCQFGQLGEHNNLLRLHFSRHCSEYEELPIQSETVDGETAFDSSYYYIL